MKVRAKVAIINAICHLGPSSLTVMGIYGQQEAKKGDYIFMHGTDPSTFEVVKKADFDDKYEVVAESPIVSPAPAPEPKPVIAEPVVDEEMIEEPIA